ncbi:hypothetical protein INR49_009185 [Caranx melampygus]|nr:hypothetical protein INR49_009185 [Caranx melampygus]
MTLVIGPVAFLIAPPPQPYPTPISSLLLGCCVYKRTGHSVLQVSLVRLVPQGICLGSARLISREEKANWEPVLAVNLTREGEKPAVATLHPQPKPGMAERSPQKQNKDSVSPAKDCGVTLAVHCSASVLICILHIGSSFSQVLLQLLVPLLKLQASHSRSRPVLNLFECAHANAARSYENCGTGIFH